MSQQGIQLGFFHFCKEILIVAPAFLRTLEINVGHRSPI